MEEQFPLGYLPVDFSFNLSTIINENRDYFTLDCKFTDAVPKTDQIDIAVNLRDHILKDQKIKDTAISNEVETSCKSYSVTDFWGMPKILQKAFKQLNPHNINKEVGFEFQMGDQNEGDEETAAEEDKEAVYDYFKDFIPPEL